MITQEILSTCSNPHVARAAVASIGGDFAGCFIAHAANRNLSSGPFAAESRSRFRPLRPRSGLGGPRDATRGADMPDPLRPALYPRAARLTLTSVRPARKAGAAKRRSPATRRGRTAPDAALSGRGRRIVWPMYLGLDCGTSGLKALLSTRAARPVARRDPRLSAGPAEARLVGAGSRRLARRHGRRDRRPHELAPAGGRRAEGDRLFRADARRGRSSTGRTGRSARRSCTTTDGPQRRRPSLPATIPHLAGVVGVKPMPGFTGPKLLWLAGMSRTAAPDRLRAFAERLSSPRALRRARHGHERRGRDLDARRGGAPLVGRGDRRLRGASPLGAAALRRVGRGRHDPPGGADALGLPHGARGRRRRRRRGRRRGRARARSRPGEAFISLGTATQLIVATDRYLSAPEKLVHSFAHALPGRWYAMAAMLNGAGALAFAARLLGTTPDALEREAADGYRGPGALFSCPIFPASGRRSTTRSRAAFCSA